MRGFPFLSLCLFVVVSCCLFLFVCLLVCLFFSFFFSFLSVTSFEVNISRVSDQNGVSLQ